MWFLCLFIFCFIKRLLCSEQRPLNEINLKFADDQVVTLTKDRFMNFELIQNLLLPVKIDTADITIGDFGILEPLKISKRWNY